MKREELFYISFWDFHILITELNDRGRKYYTTKYKPYPKSTIDLNHMSWNLLQNFTYIYFAPDIWTSFNVAS